ncbi:MAG: TlpA disulfide reductase family protein [Myxococcota bacterium]
MPIGWWVAGIAGVAVAGEAELDLERGRVAFELEQYTQARDRAIAALAATPSNGTAHQLYVDATTASGLGSRGLFELVSFEVETQPWHAAVESLGVAVGDDDWKAVKTGVGELRAQWPGSPDLLIPLWSSRSSKIVKLRQKVVKELADPEAIAAAELEALYHLRRLAVEIDDPTVRAAAEQALVDRGEEQPPPRVPMDRLARTELAVQLAKEPVPALPWTYPSEVVDLGLRLEEILLKARRFRHVALAWQQVQRTSDDPTAWTHEANAWLLEGELDKAQVAATAAVARATRPRNVDLVAMNVDRQRADLAQALLVRAKVYEATGDLPRALGEYGVAVALAGARLDDRLGERLDRGTLAAVDGTARRYGSGVPAERALAQAVKTDDHDTAVGILSDARFLAAVGTSGGRTIADDPEAYVELFGATFLAEAELDARAGRIENARADAVIATVLTGRAHPFWWVTRGELQDKNGEYDAAFASWAVARGLGVRDLDENLARTYIGIADWEVGANNLGGAPPEVAAVRQALAVGTSAPRVRKTALVRPTSAPRLGETFPSFSIDSGYGTLTNASLHGRIAVITFWRSTCGECLQMLPAFGTLARRLRAEGHDMMVVGVSVDDDPVEFERVFTEGQRWAELVWAPDLRDRFAVDALPTTWVIDTAGVARYYVDHWLSVEELETYVRDVD